MSDLTGWREQGRPWQWVDQKLAEGIEDWLAEQNTCELCGWYTSTPPMCTWHYEGVFDDE